MDAQRNYQVLFRFVVNAVLLIGLTMGIGTAVIRLWGTGSNLMFSSMVSAGIVSLIPAIVCILPLAAFIRSSLVRLARGFLFLSALRIVLTLCAAGVTYKYILKYEQRVSFALWIMIFYLILLFCETVTVLKIGQCSSENSHVNDMEDEKIEDSKERADQA
ncbi:MAG: hypothetical protein JW860_05755 [Sedimentisphaerales bacterium]|nr:hypothetical protein [Sedimentisphaerales bacterium]